MSSNSNNTNFSGEVLQLDKLDITLDNIKAVLFDSSDVMYQSFAINEHRGLTVDIVYIDGMVDIKMVNDDIIRPLLNNRSINEAGSCRELIDLILNGAIYHASRKVPQSLSDTLDEVLTGSVALIFSNEKTAITFDSKGFEKRAIEEPTTENALKGAKDSFIEVLRTNTSLVRRKIRTPYLRIKEIVIGKQTKTRIDVIYIENLTNPNLVNEVMKRLEKIDIDGAITAGSIEEYIIDKKNTIFPQLMSTERCDKFSHNIIEGRVGIIIDGLPLVYILPATIDIFYQAPEDYAQNYIISSFIRFLRYVGSVMTLLLPGFYVSITSFHQEMIPTKLAISIIKSKSEVPFPTVTSIIIMLIAFEVLLEAGLRLPRAIGQAVSIIGALVVGQAAVQAKIISPVVVIVVATTGIFGFTMPNQDYSNALRVLRLIFVIGAAIAGLYGLSLLFIITIYHLNTIENFGVPYFSPFVANEGKEVVRDTIIRAPLWLMKKRPSSLKTTNKKRQG